MFFNNCFESFEYYFLEDLSAPIQNPRHIIFVCKGNVCRSPFAEYDIKKIGKRLNIEVESCGLEVEQKKHSPPEAVQAAEEFGIDLKKHISKGLDACNFEDADLILLMELAEYRRLTDHYPEKRGHIKLLRKYAPFPFSLFCNIDDPYGCDDREFAKCFALIDKAVKSLLHDLGA